MTYAAKIAAAILTASAAAALDDTALPWPLEETHREALESASYLLPIGPFRNGAMPFLSIEGRLERTAFRIDSAESTLELTRQFRDWLRLQGYEVLFHCHDRGCGGFDFRAELDLVPAPAIYFDLGDFHFVAAEKKGEQTEYAALLISRSTGSGYAQIDIAQASVRPPSRAVAAERPAAMRDSVPAGLESDGHAALDSLEFASGSPDLGPGPYAQLIELAAYLEANPDSRVLLVGHTDSMGSRDANFELSKKRAESVAARLTEVHGVDPKQISAEGIGFLAPRATNSTPAGRQLNRRVEAVLITSE